MNARNRARILRESAERPPVAANDRLCIRCSLAPVCLPEEERFAANPQWEPLRLFPADRELVTLHVSKPGARIGRAGDTIKIDVPNAESRSFPIEHVGALVMHGQAQISTQAVHLCADREIGVHWLSGAGRYVAGLSPGAGSVQRKLRQFGALSDETRCVDLARTLVMAKVESGLKYLLRATRKIDRAAAGIHRSLAIMRSSIKAVARTNDRDSVRGHEGMAGKAYFAVLPALLSDKVPAGMIPAGRNRRPPKDPFNALLGFGYALLYQAMLQAVISVGLEPALGFFHKPRSSAHPLVLDLMELFRCPVWDMTVIASINRGQWDCDADFSITPGRVWLSECGRAKAISLFENRLQDEWKHPVIGYSLSYARMLELETRLLEKEWTGSPGLFARMRIR
jgi:CRISPR-associated protein Cas1